MVEVAENSMICASNDTWPSRRLTGGRKPISAISSASSITATSTFSNVSACCSKQILKTARACDDDIGAGP